MNISVQKLTDVSLLQRANSFTSGKESHMTLAKAYRHGHSPIRTQLFWVEMREIPLFVASQLVRSHVGVQYFQLSKRPDRGGADFNDVCRNIAFEVDTCWITAEGELPNAEKGLVTCQRMAREIEMLPYQFDRYAPTDLAFIINADALINMAHKRLCHKASKETRDIVTWLCREVHTIDKDLGRHLVPQCVFRGGICPEPRCCGFINSGNGQLDLDNYKDLFND